MRARPVEPTPPEELPDLPPLTGDGAIDRARDFLARGRRSIDESFDAGAPAREVVRRRSELHDRLLVRLFEAADDEFRRSQGSPDARLSLCAVGGYGRGELSPASDLDLLFLYPYEPGAYVESVSERLQYRLWDLGLEIGCSVRSIDECIRIARSDLASYTSLLDHRFLAGDRQLYEEFDRELFRAVFSRGVSQFFEMRAQADEARRERYADTIYLLEPNLKLGEGGLRDLHQALWAARVRFRARGLEDLLRIGAVSEREARALSGAHDFLLEVRELLHRLSGRKSDRLTFEVQEQIAAALGHRDTRRALGVEKFMQRYYQAARTIHQLADRILERCALSARRRKPPRGSPVGVHFRLFEGTLTVRGNDVFRRHPVALLEIFREAMLRNVGLHGFAKDLVADHVHRIDGRVRKSAQAAACFLEVLTWPEDRRETLRQMHDLGVLGAYLPEFARITGKHQHTVYHVYTVDVHTLHAIEHLKSLHRGDLEKEAPHVSEVMAQIERPRTLYLGLLFHDVGKGSGRDHSQAGAELAVRACQRLGLTPEEVAEVDFLVRKHLLMVHLATRRDMHDEELVRGFCAEVGDSEMLRKLYVLTYVDSITTGPNVWSQWKAMLVRELYERALARMQGAARGDVSAAAAAEARRADAAVLLAGRGAPAEVEAFLRDMPDRYFLSTRPEAVAHHFEVARRLKRRPFAMRRSHFSKRGYTELIIACRDRPGLLSLLTGALAANRIDILGAAIFTRATGETLDVFYVRDRAGHAVQNAAVWRRFAEHFKALLAGEVTAEALVQRSQRTSPLDRPGPTVRTKVNVDNEASAHYTVIDVYTQDRLGVLYLITRTLFELGLSIGLSKVVTEGNRVVDAFYVTDVEGRKITDERRIEEIRERLVLALSPGSR